MGYVQLEQIPKAWPPAHKNWGILSTDNTRQTPGPFVNYCHATPEAKRIIDVFLVRGSLNRNRRTAYLDGLHIDGVNAFQRCADAGVDPFRLHGHHLKTNEILEGLDQNLARARFAGITDSRLRRFLDQEIPVEALLHRFDSNAQVFSIGRREYPRIHAMVYGTLTRYSFPLYVYGENRAANEFEIFDLHQLTALVEGGIPLLFYFDSPESPILNEVANPRTTAILQSYFANYKSILTQVFGWSLVPAPVLDPDGRGSPPQCALTYYSDILVRGVSGLVPVHARTIPPTDLLVHAAAFSSGIRAAVVLMNWCAPLDTTNPPIGNSRPVILQRSTAPCEVRTRVTLTMASNAVFQQSLPVSVALDVRLLGLNPSVQYPVRIVLLHPAQQPSPVPFIGQGQGGQQLLSVGKFHFNMPSPSLAVLYIG
jgi:hypothetical protein